MLAHFDHYYNEERPEIQQYLRTDWLYNPVLTYVLLKPGKNPLLVEAELNALKDRHADERVIKGVTLVITTFEGYSLALRFFICGRSEQHARCLYSILYRSAHSASGVYKLHQSLQCSFFKKSQRNWRTESPGSPKVIADDTISQ